MRWLLILALLGALAAGPFAALIVGCARGDEPPAAIVDEPPAAIVEAPDTRQVAVAAWLAQPLNRGSCPCAATGGCHCAPHSACAQGGCVQHNPLLQPDNFRDVTKVPTAAPCPTWGTPSQAGRSGRHGWYPGKLLGR